MKKFKQRILKVFCEQKEGVDMVLPAGTTLYHGTVEQFKKENVLPGQYDDVFWTTEHADIAKTYIPSSGGMQYITTEDIRAPSQDETSQDIQKKLGIDYDYSNVEFDQTGRVKSYFGAPIFNNITKKKRKLFNNFYSIEKEIKKYEEEVGLNDKDFMKKYGEEKLSQITKKYNELEKEYEEAKDEYYSFDDKEKMNEIVNKGLKKYGYEPQAGTAYNKNYNWKLKISGGELKPADYSEKGRLFTVKPKRDMKIYDITFGGKRESDLMDLDYHDLETFKWAEESGYDGIKITDFAQTERYGNVMHTSIGFFKDAIKDLEIEEEDAVHPDQIEGMVG